MAAAAPSLAKNNNKGVNLSGAWTLNKDASDDPEKVMESMHMQPSGPSAGSSRHGPRGMGPGMHGGGMPPEPIDPEQIRARVRQLEAPPRLTITQMNDSITFMDGDKSQTFVTTNKKQEVLHGNRTVEVKTKWDKGRLVKKTALGDGMKLTETYSLVDGPRRLHVLVTLDGSHLPQALNFNRVYDAESTQ